MKPLTKLPGLDRRALVGGAVITWVAASPWLWGFAGSHAAVANHVFMVFTFGPLAMLIAALRPAAFVTMIGGLWLVLSPWVLGYATDHQAWLNELVTGLLLIVLAADAAGIRPVRARRRGAARSASAERRSATPAGPATLDPAGNQS
jgi:SPW repeat